MMTRIALIASAAFWLTMNFLLWRAEYGQGNAGGAPAPVDLVWKKIITAPDNSSLTIFHNGRKAGYCRWTVSTGQSPAAAETGDEPGPELLEMVNNGYRLDLNGNVMITGSRERYQFECGLRLATNQDWESFRFRVATHSNSVSIRASASEEAVQLSGDGEGGRFSEKFTLAELRDPASLARAMDVPMPFALSLPGLGSGSSSNSMLKMFAPTLNWEARNDRLTIGHAAVRVYRLRSRFLDKYEITIYVSPVGEIMRMELPDGWLLMNDDAAGVPAAK